MFQLVINKNKQLVQQPVIAPVLTILQVIFSFPTHISIVQITKHQMKDNLEIHMEEVHLEEIFLENHLSIQLLDLMDGQHLAYVCLYHHGINHLLCNMYQN